MKLGIALSSLVLSSVAWAAGGHTHGAGKLEIGQDDGRLSARLVSPMADMVGFETQTPDAAQQAALMQARATLEGAPPRPQGGNCRLESAEFSGFGSETHEHHDHDHDEKSAHADVSATWHWACDGDVEQITLELFDAFPTLERIQVTYLADGVQDQQRLTPAQPTYLIP